METIFKGVMLAIEAIGALIVGLFSLVGIAVSGIGVLVILLLMAGISFLLLVPVIFIFMLVA